MGEQHADAALQSTLAKHFSLEELKLLCFDIGIDPETVPYFERGKDIYACCIVEICRKQNLLLALLARCAEARPEVPWSTLPVATAVPAEWAELFTAKALINTQGGAAFLGDIHVDGGDFVGRDKIITVITQGLGDLPIRYDGNVRNFLSYYIGTDQQPAPFGGRAADLARLDNWLNDVGAPHYAFLAAPAGRGKSALLAHWVMQLQRREDVHVVFFPISIRYATNRDTVAFVALAARTAHVHGDGPAPRKVALLGVTGRAASRGQGHLQRATCGWAVPTMPRNTAASSMTLPSAHPPMANPC